MADPKKRLSENVEGLFFVDSTCIDCDTCRQLAPENFDESGDYSFVYHQPETSEQLFRSSLALLSCPTGSIGTLKSINLLSAREALPEKIESNVYYNGFASPNSFGASSYFIQHPEGNWLIDSPKYLPHLRDKLAAMGGIRYIFLSHRDDVCDAHRYAEIFGSERLIHRSELSAEPKAEHTFDGYDPIKIGTDFTIIPTPGHTKGHAALLYKDRYLFSGDHLWWSRNRNGLTASQSVCWYSWPMQIESVKRLLDHKFEWVLPGHGERANFAHTKMQSELRKLLMRIG